MTSLVSLFFGALLAATILPFSSELMLIAALKTGEHFIITKSRVTRAL